MATETTPCVCGRAAPCASHPELVDLIRFACADPGALIPRKRDADGYELLHAWQARAVMEMLGRSPADAFLFGAQLIQDPDDGAWYVVVHPDGAKRLAEPSDFRESTSDGA